jgi:hypothetical protein
LEEVSSYRIRNSPPKTAQSDTSNAHLQPRIADTSSELDN